jgi:hypothetical protein
MGKPDDTGCGRIYQAMTATDRDGFLRLVLRWFSEKIHHGDTEAARRFTENACLSP